ncbi:MAG: replicative DNA helicase [Alphaproteobacteria bacterium]|nr:replicative DNA helicase [Alphaproteobacteria bacterium]
MENPEINRTPPYNVEAEQALLGAILLDNQSLEKVSEFLKPDHFSNPAHGQIYEACRTYIEQGRIADPTTIKPLFAKNEELKNVGGAEYLTRLAAAASPGLNVGDYGRLILDRYIRRQLIHVGNDIVNDAFDIKLDSEAIAQIEEAEKKLYEIANEGEADGGPKPLRDALLESLTLVEKAKKNPTGVSGVSTGLADIDKLLGGLHNSDLIILAGRPAMGKTALATTIAFNAAQKFADAHAQGDPKKSVAFFSLEMSAEQLATRILSAKTEISSHHMRLGKIDDSQFDELAAGVDLLNKIPLYVDDTPGITVTGIKNRARRLARDKAKGLGLIVVDYLQLVTAGGRNENRVQELSEMTRALKIMAKELNVPVIVLSQLSRMVEQRENKHPQLSDLRESGSIEQDADIVMFVYREVYYLKQEEPVQRPNETADKFILRKAEWEKRKLEMENIAEAVVAKQRHGPTGIVRLFFKGEYGRFTDLIQNGSNQA